MSDSNLSKIKPSLRTKGNITGNFGKSKVKAGSSLNDLGDGGVGSLPSKEEYFERLVVAYPQLSARARVTVREQLRSLGATLDCLDVVNSIVEVYG